MIYGVSTGTLDDNLARSFEQGTPLPSKRVASLHWLQNNGYRTFGMICPSLPQHEYDGFAREIRDAICAEKCEHVWAEVINVRGDSMTRTIAALRAGGNVREALLAARGFQMFGKIEHRRRTPTVVKDPAAVARAKKAWLTMRSRSAAT